MATPDTNAQLATLRTRLGEPEDANLARWSPAQLLAQLISSRNEIAEQTHCYQVKDSIDFTAGGSVVAPVSQALPASAQPFIVSTVNDFIWLDLLTWEGRPLRCVRPGDWADVAGDDDTLNGDPTMFMFFGRQIQITRVPTEAGTLQYRGYSYPPALVAGGVDTGFTTRPADVAVWHAAMVLKGSDERPNAHEERMANRGIMELKLQYRPRGPRFVRTGDLYTPGRPLF